MSQNWLSRNWRVLGFWSQSNITDILLMVLLSNHPSPPTHSSPTTPFSLCCVFVFSDTWLPLRLFECVYEVVTPFTKGIVMFWGTLKGKIYIIYNIIYTYLPYLFILTYILVLFGWACRVSKTEWILVELFSIKVTQGKQIYEKETLCIKTKDIQGYYAIVTFIKLP